MEARSPRGNCHELTKIKVDETVLTRYMCMVIIDPTLGSLNQQIAVIIHLPRGPHHTDPCRLALAQCLPQHPDPHTLLADHDRR